MLRSSLSSCWCDAERFLIEGIEDLLGFYTSDAVFLSEGLNGVAAKRIGAWYSWRPTPGQKNTISVSTAPPSIVPNRKPTTVATGGKALRKARSRTTVCSFKRSFRRLNACKPVRLKQMWPF